MKKNVFSKITGLALAVAALMCFSCRQNLDFNVIDKAAESGKTQVKIGTEMRTALPVNTTADLTDIVFSGKLHGSDAEAENYRTWANYAALSADTTPIEFDAANYDLTLTAKAGAFTYKGVLDDFEIAGATMTISFPMKLFSLDASLLAAASETGSFEVKLYFTNSSSRNVTSAKAWLYKVETAEENGGTVESEVLVEGWDGKTITLTDGSSSEPDGISSSYKIADTIGSDLPAGHYVVMWELYTGSDSLKLIDKDPTREDIYIDGGKNSKSLKKLGSIERNYTITFNLNGGSWATGFAAPTHYTRLTKPEFPSDSDVADRTGYAFGGWYASSDFSGSPVTSIADSEVSNKTYYAKWTPNTYSITYNGMDDAEFKWCTAPSTFKYDEEIILPRPSKAGYNFRGWFADAGCTPGLSNGVNNRIARIKAKSRTEDVTLYAKWEPVEQVRMVYAYDIAEVSAFANAGLTHLCMAFIGHNTSNPTTDIAYKKFSHAETQTKVNAFRAAYPNTKLIGSYAGGDSGSDVCSDLIVDATNRKKIIDNIVKFVATYNLDGIDLDWEYFSSYSTYNPVYATFTTELRAALDENFKDYILLTIAVQKGSSFYTDSRIKEMLCKFDFIGLMSYDCGSSLRGTYEKQSTKVNDYYLYKMGSSKVPHISFNGRHKPGTYVSGGNTDSDNDISSVIDSYAAITGADKLVAGIGYYGHAYYILPEGVQIAFANPGSSNDKHYSKGVKSGDETAYFATVADIAEDKVVEGLVTVHPAQGSVFDALHWGTKEVKTSGDRQVLNAVTGAVETVTATEENPVTIGKWKYDEYRIAAGSTYDYKLWKKFAKEQGTDKEKTVTTGHFASQDGFVAYEYFETDVDYAYTDGEGNPQTCKLYALYVFDDATAISGKVAEYVKPVAEDGKGCAGAMAWVFEGDDSAHDLNNALVAAVTDNCAYTATDWEYAEHESTIDAMRYYPPIGAEPTGGWKIYDVDDLVKLASVVNGGNSLSGVTITQMRDITFNDSVLGDGWNAPAEASAGQPNANLVVFDGIGTKGKPFSGTYNGQGYKISGLYIFTTHSGTGFFGHAKNATLKNIIIKDACVLASGADDSNDDRIGGLCAILEGGSVSNCVFFGTVGSEAAVGRGGNYEYVSGLAGRCDAAATATNCVVVAKLYYESNSGENPPICGYKATNLTTTNVKGYLAEAYTGDAVSNIDSEITAVVNAAKEGRQ